MMEMYPATCAAVLGSGKAALQAQPMAIPNIIPIKISVVNFLPIMTRSWAAPMRPMMNRKLLSWLGETPRW